MPESSELDNEQPWERLPEENNLWYSRFSAYLALGPARSMREVYRQEKGKPHSTAVPGTWNTMFRQFDWRARAMAYDEYTRKKVFTQGNASDTERIKNLSLLAERMYIRLMAEIDTIEVNERFLAQYLTLLDLLAKHTGGYVHRVEHTGKDGKPIEVQDEQTMRVIFYMPEIGSFDHPQAPVQVTETDDTETT